VFSVTFLKADEKKTIPPQKRNNVLVRFSDYSYIPSEYYDQREKTGLNVGEYTDQKPTNYNNRVPQFAFKYFVEKANLGIEYSFFKVEQTQLTTASLFYNPDRSLLTFNNPAFPNVIRRENKLNVTRDFELNDSNSISFGIGIRNIYKESYRRLYTYKDQIKSDTYGLQFLLRYQLKLSENFSWNTSIEPFYTTGRRTENNSPFLNQVNIRIPNIFDGRETYTYFYGYDFDTNLAYHLSENFSLVIGYNYLRTRVRTQSATSDFYYIPEVSSISIQPRTKENTDDNLLNYYIGLKGEF
jgi:outer membrane protein (TIGR04327 family)